MHTLAPNEQRSTVVLYRFNHAIILILAIGLIGFAQVSASYVGGILYSSPRNEMKTTSHEYAQAAPEVQKTDDDGKALLPWFCAGTLAGGFVCVGARRLSTAGEAARYFGVSVAVGILAGPITVLSLGSNYFPMPRWYHALAVSGAYAGAAWFLIELITFAGGGIMIAAKERGIVGIRDQVVFILTLGAVNNNPKQNNQADTNTPNQGPASTTPPAAK